jgi:hypothetical protein
VEGERDQDREGRVAAVSASDAARQRAVNSPSRVRLTPEQVKMLMSEDRCFKCYKVGHKKEQCRSAAATTAPVSLKGQAPKRS